MRISKMAKETYITFRLTDGQKEEIEKQAEVLGISVSQYLRQKLFDDLPVNTSVNIRELKSSMLDAQKCINGIARACSSSKTFSRSDYRNIMDLMKKIDTKYYELIREIRRSNELAYQETAAAAGKEEGDSHGDYKTDQN